ncbi:hypothetical protein PCASD_24167, partial [Puccinia coronata f. sp. avenae]
MILYERFRLIQIWLIFLIGLDVLNIVQVNSMDSHGASLTRGNSNCARQIKESNGSWRTGAKRSSDMIISDIGKDTLKANIIESESICYKEGGGADLGQSSQREASPIRPDAMLKLEDIFGGKLKHGRKSTIPSPASHDKQCVLDYLEGRDVGEWERNGLCVEGVAVSIVNQQPLAGGSLPTGPPKMIPPRQAGTLCNGQPRVIPHGRTGTPCTGAAKEETYSAGQYRVHRPAHEESSLVGRYKVYREAPGTGQMGTVNDNLPKRHTAWPNLQPQNIEAACGSNSHQKHQAAGLGTTAGAPLLCPCTDTETEDGPGAELLPTPGRSYVAPSRPVAALGRYQEACARLSSGPACDDSGYRRITVAHPFRPGNPWRRRGGMGTGSGTVSQVAPL